MERVNWLVRALVGPCLWALAFAGLYSLHGLGCAQGWFAVSTPVGNLHRVLLVAGYVLAVLVTALACWRVPRGQGTAAAVVATGGWIGFGATVLTLFPVLGVSSCG